MTRTASGTKYGVQVAGEARGVGMLLCRREGNDTSPLTNQPLAHKMLMPCGTMRWCMMDVVHFVTAMRRQVL